MIVASMIRRTLLPRILRIEQLESTRRPSFSYQAIGLLSFGLCFLATVGCKPSASPETSSEAKLVRVKTVALQAKDVEKETAQPATILPYYETGIRSRVSGYVAQVSVDIGEVVEAGQTLAKISTPEIEKQLSAAEARVVYLRSQEKEAEAQASLADAKINAAKARLEQARSELLEQDALLAAADAELSRTQDLVTRGSLQQRLLDEAQKKRDSAKASQSAVSSALRSAEAEVLVAQSSKLGAEAAVTSAAANTSIAIGHVEELQVMLAYSEIKAPFAGVITQRHVAPGDLMSAERQLGSQPLFVLHQTDKVRVQVRVPENHAPLVQKGDKLTLRFPAFRSEPPVVTTVKRVSSSLDASTRSVTVEAELENPDGKWLPGMFGEATLSLTNLQAANMLPARAVRFDAEGKAFVYLLAADNSVTVEEVQTGLDTGSEIEILSGVTDGQRVIGPHLARFTEGQVVDPL